MCCLFLFFSCSSLYSQDFSTDSSIIKEFADTSIEKMQPAYLLVKILPSATADFKFFFRDEVKRQVAKHWFIVTNNDAINTDTHHYIIKKYESLNNWKYSAGLEKLQQNLSLQKTYNFLLGVNNMDVFLLLAEKYPSDIEVIKILSNAKLVLVKTNFSFIKNYVLPNTNFISVDMRLTIAKEEAVINNYDNTENNINLFFAKYPGIAGEGLCVSVKENFFDTTDIDFKNRYKSSGLNSSFSTSHATTMATLIGGAGNSFFTGKGVAWKTNISSSDFAVLLPDNDNIYKQYGITVQNHSYGVSIENFYGSDAAAYDESMVNDSALLHIFSSGNAGDETPGDGVYKGLTGFANLTGSFKMAKNIITVGSVDSFYNVPLLSSKGPAYDGRVKPDLVAYGNDGSSGAAAITSGTALAIQSAYQQQHGNQIPANALIKAILINSADDVYTKGPDFYSGYGNVNTYRAVTDILSGNYFQSSAAQNEVKDFKISLPANARNLKITLVWTDQPAQANAFTALVNDLDLSLERNNDHTKWLPWVLNSVPNADSLNAPAQRKRDSINVTEQITIDQPLAGSYTIHVKGYNVFTASQSFAIAYSWDTLNKFYFISPAKEDHFESAGKSIFRWHNTYETTTGKLEYSIDNGNSWVLINGNVDLTKNYYQWKTPNTFALALARMTIGTDRYTSDTFNFSTQLYPKVGFYCSDSVLVYWNKAKGINNYKFYRLGDKYMQPVATTNDTSIVISNSANASPFVNVTTVINSNYTGVNSYTFNFTTQGVGCYISNFLADLNVNNNATLQLEISTTVGISQVIFQELTSSGWQNISTIENISGMLYTFEDKILHNGINTYRAAIKLTNGKMIYSDEASVNYFANNSFVVLPNPVQNNQKLVVLSNSFLANAFSIYDVAGRQLMHQQITNARTEISVSNLAHGIYFLVIFQDNQKVFRAKVLVE